MKMVGTYSKSILPFISLLFFWTSQSAWSQQNINYQYFEQTLPEIDSSIHLNTYNKAFVIHFNFCSSTKYCGQKMVDFIAKTKGDKILIICDNADAKILEPLRTQNRFELKQINQTILTQYGLFSVYNLYIYPQKRKIVKLQ